MGRVSRHASGVGLDEWAVPLVGFMRAFAKRKYLRRKVRLEFRDGGRPRLYCSEPAIVARFVSQVRQELVRKWPDAYLLLRGQSKNRAGMVPSLFRGPSQATEQTLRDAEAYLERQIASALPKNERFQRPNLAALLQHYGVKTRWLDVVDDLRVAIWFATHDLGDGEPCRRRRGSGWIYLISTRTNAGKLTACDLRLAHHGLSLRPHVQQGWSVSGAGKDLNPWVVATVEFPIGSSWHLDGHLARPAFLFPPVTLDDTLRRLSRAEVAACVRDAEARYGLAPDVLGKISNTP